MKKFMSIKIYAQIPKTISKTNKNYYGTKKKRSWWNKKYKLIIKKIKYVFSRCKKHLTTNNLIK